MWFLRWKYMFLANIKKSYTVKTNGWTVQKSRKIIRLHKKPVMPSMRLLNIQRVLSRMKQLIWKTQPVKMSLDLIRQGRVRTIKKTFNKKFQLGLLSLFSLAMMVGDQNNIYQLHFFTKPIKNRRTAKRAIQQLQLIYLTIHYQILELDENLYISQQTQETVASML